MCLPARPEAIRSPLKIWSAEIFPETFSTKAAQRSSWPAGWKAHVVRLR